MGLDIVKYRGMMGSALPKRGYVGGLEELAGRLRCDLEEARLFRMSMLSLFEDGYDEGEVLGIFGDRGYILGVVTAEYRRCVEIFEYTEGLVRAKVMSKKAALQNFRDRVLGIGQGVTEMSKDEVAGVLSGMILDSRVGVRDKLSAIDLLGKYRDFYKSEDRDVRIVVENKAQVSGSVVGDGLGGIVIPDGLEAYGG
jgi:hypothetical protein